jgi:hypothetical protein
MNLLYVQTQGGRVIHYADCSHTGDTAVAWDWAAGKTVEEIRQELAALRLDARFCRHCIGMPRDEP